MENLNLSTIEETNVMENIPYVPVWSFRFNFTNGVILKFQFDENASIPDLANEMKISIDKKVKLLNLKNTKGKSYFSSGKMLPNRKFTMDIIRDGKLLHTEITGNEIQPSHIREKDGNFLEQVLTTIITK